MANQQPPARATIIGRRGVAPGASWGSAQFTLDRIDALSVVAYTSDVHLRFAPPGPLNQADWTLEYFTVPAGSAIDFDQKVLSGFSHFEFESPGGGTVDIYAVCQGG